MEPESIRDLASELKDLAAELDPPAWRSKALEDMTTKEQAAFYADLNREIERDADFLQDVMAAYNQQLKSQPDAAPDSPRKNSGRNWT